MQIIFGNDHFSSKQNKVSPVIMDTSKLINGHVIIVGSSGVGKSFTIRRMIKQAKDQGNKLRFHVFDVHGDLDIDGASSVIFSEQADFGLNPLRVNPDPHFGGVRKCIQSFIRVVNQASTTALGLKQEAVLRNLLLDVFKEFGFHQDNPASWTVDPKEALLVSAGSDNRVYLNVPISEKDEAKGLGARWDPDKKLWWIHTEAFSGGILKWAPALKERTYPSLADVAKYATRIHEERFLGSDQKSVRALSTLNKKAQAFQRKVLDSVRKHRIGAMSLDDKEKLELAKTSAVDAYTEYVNSIQTGEELENLMKYDSPDVLKSVVDRLNNLLATGIYKDVPPPFQKGCPVWRYKLNALSSEEKKMMVLFLLQDIFNKAIQRGEQSDVSEVVVLDELSTYTGSQDEDGDGIIGIIAREARKFGLALWAANQSPANIPESLLSSVATKIILGIDEMYWNSAVSKLRIETKQLAWIQPHHSIAVQMKERGALKNKWWWIELP